MFFIIGIFVTVSTLKTGRNLGFALNKKKLHSRHPGLIKELFQLNEYTVSISGKVISIRRETKE